MITVKTYMRGWPIVWVGNSWFYEDTGEPFDDSRPCKQCNRMPTSEGYDACLGRIEGVTSACCGHGLTEPTTQKVEA